MRALAGQCQAVAAALVLLLFGGLWSVGGAPASPHAAAARNVNEHVTLKLAERHGSTKFSHTGRATGSVSGSVRSTITLAHAVVLKGTVTITTSRGKVRMKIDGRARSLALRTKFSGKAKTDGGTGHYANASGEGTFTGIVNRQTWAITIDATGSLGY
jgi:hypothetical protein